jgi:hypothetical protein
VRTQLSASRGASKKPPVAVRGFNPATTRLIERYIAG